MRAFSAVLRSFFEQCALKASEIIPVKGVVLVGPLPAEIQNSTTYAAAISSQSKEKGAAKALIDALTSPTAAAVLKSKGMDPAK